MPLNVSGLLAVGSSLLSWALLLVVSRVVLLAHHLDPWLFTLIQMMAGGGFLVAIATSLSLAAPMARSAKTPAGWPELNDNLLIMFLCNWLFSTHTEDIESHRFPGQRQ